MSVIFCIFAVVKFYFRISQIYINMINDFGNSMGDNGTSDNNRMNGDEFGRSDEAKCCGVPDRDDVVGSCGSVFDETFGSDVFKEVSSKMFGYIVWKFGLQDYYDCGIVKQWDISDENCSRFLREYYGKFMFTCCSFLPDKDFERYDIFGMFMDDRNDIKEFTMKFNGLWDETYFKGEFLQLLFCEIGRNVEVLKEDPDRLREYIRGLFVPFENYTCEKYPIYELKEILSDRLMQVNSSDVEGGVIFY